MNHKINHKISLKNDCDKGYGYYVKSFISKDDYNKLDESEKENYGIKNSYYSTDEFRNDYRQALFNILDSQDINKFDITIL